MELSSHRKHSRTENFLLNSKLRFEINEASNLTTLFNFVHAPTAMDPGALTRERVGSDRRQAAIQNALLDAGESVMQGRVGTIYHHQLSDQHEITFTLYNLFRDFNQVLPFNRAVDFDHFSAGGGMKYIFQGDVLGLSNRLITGIDLQYQEDDRRNFDNPEGKPGEKLQLHQNEQVTSLGPFLHYESRIHRIARLRLGLRYDQLRFQAADFLLTNGDDSGKRVLDAFSPMLGLIFTLQPSLNLYGNLSTAFETPTTTELSNRPTGQGGFNPGLQPQRATSYEVGLKGIFRQFRYDLTLFSISIKDKLILFEIPTMPGKRFYRNAGSAMHQGLEFGLRDTILEGLTASLAYTYADFRFKDFKTDKEIFDDNQIPGIPPNQLYTEISYHHHSRIGGSLEFIYQDDFFVDDANTVVKNAFTVVNFYTSHSVWIENLLSARAPFYNQPAGSTGSSREADKN